VRICSRTSAAAWTRAAGLMSLGTLARERCAEP
jgi:hypothetical protein